MAQALEHVMIIKIDFDGDMRRISMTLPEDASSAETFQEIRTAVAQGFDMVEAALPALKYLDEEADICTLVEASVDDMMQFSKNGTLRLFAKTARVEGPVADETPGKMHRPEPVAEALGAVKPDPEANNAIATETTDAAREQAALEKAEAEWAVAESEQAAAEKVVAEKAVAERVAAEQVAAEQAAAEQAAVEQVAAEWAAAEAEQAVAEEVAAEKAAAERVAAEQVAAEQAAAKQAAVEQVAAEWAAAKKEQAAAEEVAAEKAAAERAEADQAVAEQVAAKQAAEEQVAAEWAAAEAEQAAAEEAAAEQAGAEQAIAQQAATSMDDLRPTEPLEGSSEQSTPAEDSSVPRRPILRNATRMDHFQVFVAKSMFRLRSFAAEVVRPVDCHPSFVRVPSASAAAEAGNAATAETEDAIDESSELESTQAFQAEMALDEFLIMNTE